MELSFSSEYLKILRWIYFENGMLNTSTRTSFIKVNIDNNILKIDIGQENILIIYYIYYIIIIYLII